MHFARIKFVVFKQWPVQWPKSRPTRHSWGVAQFKTSGFASSVVDMRSKDLEEVSRTSFCNPAIYGPGGRNYFSWEYAGP